MGVYAVWTVMFGIVVPCEPASAARMGCIVLIVAGIGGLKLLL